MPRQNILTKLRDAKMAHVKWVRRAKHLVESLPITEEMIPLDSTECAFGCWLYADGMKFKSMPRASSILSAIEKEHSALHDIYLKIYRIYFIETKRGPLSKIFMGHTKKVKLEKQTEALTHFEKLKKVSERLVFEVDNFEKELMSVDINLLQMRLRN